MLHTSWGKGGEEWGSLPLLGIKAETLTGRRKDRLWGRGLWLLMLRELGWAWDKVRGLFN